MTETAPETIVNPATIDFPGDPDWYAFGQPGDTLGELVWGFNIDQENNRLYCIKDGDINAGIRVYDYQTLELISAHSRASLGIPSPDPRPLDRGALSKATQRFYFQPVTNERDPVHRLDLASMSVDSTLGLMAIFLGDIKGPRLCRGNMIVLHLNGRDFVTLASYRDNPYGSAVLTIFDGDAMSEEPDLNYVKTFTIGGSDRDIALAVSDVVVAPLTSVGSVFALTGVHSVIAGPGIDAPVQLRKLTLSEDGSEFPPTVNSLLAEFAYTDIDADALSWALGGCVGTANVDRTDGNLLATVRVRTGPLESDITPYLVKFDAATGELLWGLEGLYPNLGALEGCYIAHGRLVYKNTSGVTSLIDTINGEVIDTGTSAYPHWNTFWDGYHGYVLGPDGNPNSPVFRLVAGMAWPCRIVNVSTRIGRAA